MTDCSAFCNPFCFQAYCDKMKSAIDLEESPLDANLEKVMPGIRQWHSTHNANVERIRQGLEALANKIDDVAVKARQEREESDRRLADSLFVMANHLSGSTVCETFPLVQVGQKDVDVEVNESLTENASGIFRMIVKHGSLSDLWNEWYGLENFDDGEGGIAGRNKKHGRKWRKHLSAQQYSRTQRVVQAINKYSEVHNVPTEEAVYDLEEAFANVGFSVAKMVDYCKAKGLLTAKLPRGKKKTREDDNAFLEAFPLENFERVNVNAV